MKTLASAFQLSMLLARRKMPRACLDPAPGGIIMQDMIASLAGIAGKYQLWKPSPLSPFCARRGAKALKWADADSENREKCRV